MTSLSASHWMPLHLETLTLNFAFKHPPLAATGGGGGVGFRTLSISSLTSGWRPTSKEPTFLHCKSSVWVFFIGLPGIRQVNSCLVWF